MKKVAFILDCWTFGTSVVSSPRTFEECRASNELKFFPQYQCMCALITEQEARNFLLCENRTLVVTGNGYIERIENKRYVANELGIDLRRPRLWERILEELQVWRFQTQDIKFYIQLVDGRK